MGEPGILQPWGSKELDMTERLNKSKSKLKLMTSLGSLIQQTKM